MLFQCSKSCGGGIQNRTATCISIPGDRGRPIDDGFCINKKNEIIRECNEDACPEWQYGENTPVRNLPFLTILQLSFICYFV